MENIAANAPKKHFHRSKVSNGTRLFIEPVDGRTVMGRRFKDLVAFFVGDLGGRDVLSEGQKQLVRRTSLISALCEEMEAQAVQQLAKFDVDKYVVLVNCQRRLCETLGLKRVQKPVNAIESLDAISAHIEAQRPSETP